MIFSADNFYTFFEQQMWFSILLLQLREMDSTTSNLQTPVFIRVTPDNTYFENAFQNKSLVGLSIFQIMLAVLVAALQVNIFVKYFVY